MMVIMSGDKWLRALKLWKAGNVAQNLWVVSATTDSALVEVNIQRKVMKKTHTGSLSLTYEG